MIRGFDPIAARDAMVLVLGTIPGRQSLAMGQYYANPQNAFWFIMERLFEATAGLDYEARTAMLKAAGVAVWDVLCTADRDRSVDAAIVAGSEVANDFKAFFAMHDQIRAVFFNGARAETLFRRFALPDLPQVRSLPSLRLPSTSPANARLTINGKLDAWRALVDALKSP
ncbi:MAG: DNA-deoxyinosine glycosylase [Syntrophus sp. (in: bacteria)]|nr:DNA-deoxyinosine glycosylase [Syntrophus sp. (in: bacteria)]